MSVKPAGGSQEQDLDKMVLDYAVKIGTTARRENVEKSQMEQLISSLEAYPHHVLCLPVAAAYARRQSTRGHLGRDTSRLVAEAMRALYRLNQDRNRGRVLLGLAKWVYEASDGLRISQTVNSFEEFLQLLAGSGGR